MYNAYLRLRPLYIANIVTSAYSREESRTSDYNDIDSIVAESSVYSNDSRNYIKSVKQSADRQ